MFSKNQQQSLNELGIQVLALQSNDAEKPASASSVAQTLAANTEQTNVHTKPEQRVTRPPLSSLLKSSQSLNSEKPLTTTSSVSEKPMSWQEVAADFISDLKVLFPQIAPEAEKLHLTNNKVWILKNNIASPLVEGETLSSGAPTNLSVDERKAVWQWLGQA